MITSGVKYKLLYERELRRGNNLQTKVRDLEEGLKAQEETFKKMFETLKYPKPWHFHEDTLLEILFELDDRIRVLLEVQGRKYGVQDLVLGENVDPKTKAVAEQLDILYTILGWDDE